jgi:outer membrane murein-binding lipoprotein Lpp
LDNAISGNEMQVDVIISALPTGAATEATLASIEGDTSALAGCVSGAEIQVDVVSSALPTGAATQRKLRQTELKRASIVDAAGDIADVKISSVNPGTDKGLVTNTIIHGLTTGVRVDILT